MLDTARRIATPEGIELELRLAGPVPRAAAWALDIVLRLAILGVLAIALGALGGFGGGIFLIIWFVGDWFRNREREAGPKVMAARLVGAGLMFAAIVLVSIRW